MNQRQFLSFIATIVAVIGVGQMAQTIFVPAIPDMADGLQVDPEQLQALMAAYLIPYGLLQFIYGPVSDRIGRKPPLLFGLALFATGCLLAVMATNINTLLLATFVQGAGTAAAGALCRSIPRDHFNSEQLIRVNAFISMAVMFAPLLAPLMGGLCVAYLGWRSVYWVLLSVSLLVIAVVVFRFKESLPVQQRNFENPLSLYRHVLASRQFVLYCSCLMATLGAVVAFESVAGILYGDVLNLNPFLVSLLFILPIPGSLAGSYYASRCKSRKKLSRIAITTALSGGLVILIPALFSTVATLSLLLGSILVFFAAGALFPTFTSKAIEPFPRQAGVAGALLGGAQNLGAGVIILIMSLMPMHGQLSIGITLIVLVLIIALTLAKAAKTEAHKK
ncbi:MFS transporter [Paraferrimonas haliotis]|uniref:MFS transporter n=1 Tax=Paraferrimonas haliotis TaxID=2013866 RepID=UPI000BA979FE|nr:MFS transporter [Paraferrimonas haliotis]